ncbi:PRC-barrel domain-containing protein [Kribbella sp. CA-293567]|uniref:PRC-barrel domain-containing protein n=1 Tax=Kribbella sp. CA-293567 TaxID=3002436 RepID=UPI0022DDF01F|nr:PRC-barrel domain-containing protein [Kribbella sp. CA-293567]WBQ03386.1 PRC-barrel domain-containing protein [Kribbella sp. CA-293567]
MAGTEPQPTLERLDDTDLTLSNIEDDVRGRDVVDRDGEPVGKVEGLFIDREECRVRLLEVSSGGFLGIGKTIQLVPVDAVIAVSVDVVQVEQDREHVARGPGYDPDLARREPPRYFADIYGYYGAAPYWTAGYTPPRFPYR